MERNILKPVKHVHLSSGAPQGRARYNTWVDMIHAFYESGDSIAEVDYRRATSVSLHNAYHAIVQAAKVAKVKKQVYVMMGRGRIFLIRSEEA